MFSEYRVEQLSYAGDWSDELTAKLNELGKEGWELSSIHNNPNGRDIHVVMKRIRDEERVQEVPPPPVYSHEPLSVPESEPFPLPPIREEAPEPETPPPAKEQTASPPPKPKLVPKPKPSATRHVARKR